MRAFSIFVFTLISIFCRSQQNIVTYCGSAGKEVFYDIVQISDGSFIVSGYADDMDWIATSVPQITLQNTESIHNGLGSGRYAFVIRFSADLQEMLQVVKLPLGVAEDIRFIKTTNVPGTATGDIFISGNTSDTEDNDGGYFIAKLNNNFVNGVPTSLVWVKNIWAESGPKDYQPWDVTSDGEVYYITGQSHAYDWSAVYCLDTFGERKVVENWRTHWKNVGGEWRGTPASSYIEGIAALDYSGIVLKNWGRCELRSWTQEDYSATVADGNGGTKMGKWPVDILFNGPCDPLSPSSNGPGYTGYSAESCCPVYGGSSIVVDRRNDHFYLGINVKSNAGSPDFESAVIAMDNTGALLWWSRLYHEITPQGDTMISIPDQYIDGLAIDYSLPFSSGMLVVAGRVHGNNSENFWEGNNIAANPGAQGFQNQFTGSNGNIHESWLGKLTLADGTLMHATYVAEMTDNTGSLGSTHPDPNLDGWTDPNTGWPDVNTTRIAKNAVRVTADGSVCIAAVGRRTITTANAYQKMVKPWNGGHSCWNNFIRMYTPELSKPLYSSLVVGVWDTITQAGGSNTDIYGICKTQFGIVGVGRHVADTNGVASGNNLPVINIPGWGAGEPTNESAVLVYYVAENIENIEDSPFASVLTSSQSHSAFDIYPNPSSDELYIRNISLVMPLPVTISDVTGKKILEMKATQGLQKIAISQLTPGIYFIKIGFEIRKFVKE